MTSGVASFSLDCILPYGKTVPRSVLRILVTLCIPVSVVVLYVVFWAAIMRKSKETFGFLKKRSLLSFFAVSYLSYVSVTKIAVNAVSCVKVYDSPELGSDSFSYYWTMDTALKCYEESHAFLAGLLGWPTLLFFSLCFPLSLSYFLIKHPPARFDHQWIHETAGFLYRAYNSRFVYWESVVMLRKALLVVVTAFRYQLGTNIQGIIAISILTFALNVHHVCRPFRKEFSDLNDYESHALLVSFLIFTSGLFFLDPIIPDGVKMMLTAVVFVAVCGLVLFLSTKLVFAFIDYAKLSIRAEGVSFPSNHGTFNIVGRFISERIGLKINRMTSFSFKRISKTRSFKTLDF